MEVRTICTKCALPATFPGIKFNADGVCNFCLEQRNADTRQRDKTAYEQKFNSLLKEKKGKSIYDAVMAYSGGKDSTYTLMLLKERYDLNVLAVTFDNGFISSQASKNIVSVVEKLGTDHIIFKPNFKVLAKIFHACATQDIFSSKTLERASTICTACMAIIKFTTLRMALEKDIPFIAFGWSPGQAPVTSSVMKNNPSMVRLMQQSLFEPLYGVVGNEIKPYFLEDKHFSGAFNFPYNIHPLAFLEYNEEHIYLTISKLGWVSPKDVDPNSTNCLLNSYANMVHKKRYHYNPYSFELANLVRDGNLDRATAIERLEHPEDPDLVKSIDIRLSAN